MGTVCTLCKEHTLCGDYSHVLCSGSVPSVGTACTLCKECTLCGDCMCSIKAQLNHGTLESRFGLAVRR